MPRDDLLRLLMARRESSQPEYQDLEWIASTGTQWLDTGVVPSSDLRVVIDFSSSANNTTMFGSRKTNTDVIQFYYVNSRFNLRVRSTSDNVQLSNAAIGITAGQRFTADVVRVSEESYGIMAGNGSVYFPSITYNGGEKPLALFADRRTDSITTYSTMTLWSIDIYNNGSLAFSGRPKLRIVDGKPGLLDSISGDFLTNSGTGEFSYG